MAALEYFEVECPEPLGGEYYRQITNDVLLDHNLLKVIEKLHIYIDPKVPVFVAVGTLRKITLVISDETYLAPMLKLFWQQFGKEHVEQPDRFTVMLYDVRMDPREIEELIVADPSESFIRDLIYAFRCVAPEGFRLRSEKFSKEKFSFVASENTLAEDIDALVAAKFALIGVKP